MSVSASDSGLKVFWIRAVLEHDGIVVGFHNYRIGLGCKAEGFFRHPAYIGHYHEFVSVYHDGIADGLCGVVRYHEISCQYVVSADFVPPLPKDLSSERVVLSDGVNSGKCRGKLRSDPHRSFKMLAV